MKMLEIIRTVALVVIAASAVKISIDVAAIRDDGDWIAHRINYIEDSAAALVKK